MELVIENLSLTYSRKVKALDDITLSVKPGVFGLLGPNGAGKSTLLKIMATTLRPTGGKVRVGRYSLPRQQHQVRRRLGYLPQVYGLFDNLTAYEFLDYIALMKGIERKATRRKEINRLLEVVNLQEHCNSQVKTFSGGMKQRLALAQALLNSPPFLVLDEPTAGLDPEERLRMRNLLSGLSGDRVVVLSTHIVPDVTAVCSHVGVLHRGKLLFVGEVTELAGRAENLVWELVSNAPGYEVAKGQVLVTSRHEGGLLKLRLLSPTPPAAGAIAVDPNPEDGYLAVISGMAHQGGGAE